MLPVLSRLNIYLVLLFVKSGACPASRSYFTFAGTVLGSAGLSTPFLVFFSSYFRICASETEEAPGGSKRLVYFRRRMRLVL